MLTLPVNFIEICSRLLSVYSTSTGSSVAVNAPPRIISFATVDATAIDLTPTTEIVFLSVKVPYFTTRSLSPATFVPANSTEILPDAISKILTVPLWYVALIFTLEVSRVAP